MSSEAAPLTSVEERNLRRCLSGHDGRLPPHFMPEDPMDSGGPTLAPPELFQRLLATLDLERAAHAETTRSRDTWKATWEAACERADSAGADREAALQRGREAEDRSVNAETAYQNLTETWQRDYARLTATEARVAALASVLSALRCGEDCWCEVAIGNPNCRGRHGDSCRAARTLLAAPDLASLLARREADRAVIDAAQDVDASPVGGGFQVSVERASRAYRLRDALARRAALYLDQAAPG